MLWDALLGLQLPNRVPVQPKTHRWGGGGGCWGETCKLGELSMGSLL